MSHHGTGTLKTSGIRKDIPGMARLSGVDLPRDKRIEVALTYIFGIGRSRSLETLAATGVNPDTRVRDLADDEVVRLREWIDTNYRVEGDLHREVRQDIRRKMEIGCYQGLRHRRNLPVHGQRTHTNARTRKGPRRAIAGKKKTGKK
jgi:small subunit ribosomal protein S13